MHRFSFSLCLCFLLACGAASDDTARHDDTAVDDTAVDDTATHGDTAQADDCDACEPDEVCLEGECIRGECPDDLYECDGDCTTLLDDVDHCGSCDYACPDADHGTVTCQQAECHIACDADALYCGGDDCSVCPPHTAVGACDGGGCVPVECDPGYTECGGICAPIPEHAEFTYCEGQVAVPGACEGSHTLETDDTCTCPDTLSPGTLVLPLEEVERSPLLGCGNFMGGGNVAAARVCGPGTYMGRMRSEDIAGMYYDTVGVAIAAADCGDAESFAATCHTGFFNNRDYDYFSPRPVVLAAGECATFFAYDDGSAPSLYVDLYGPLTDATAKSATKSDSALVFTGSPVVFTDLELTRSSGQNYNAWTFYVKETLPTGQWFEYKASMPIGTTSIRLGLQYFGHSGSTWTVRGLDWSQGLTATTVGTMAE